MQLPDQMPQGCNFYALLQTELTPVVVAQRFAAVGWSGSQSSEGQRLDIGWGQLTLTEGSPMVLQGWLDRPDDRVNGILDLLRGPGLAQVSQWINSAGQLWRDMPFDESMLDPNDPRLPADIKESILANRAGAVSTPQPRKPWWRFW
jgi:hypothetical protein